MGAVLSGGIEGVSARYAAQIRELIHVQAMKRLAAEQESVRRDAEAAARAERLEALMSRPEGPAVEPRARAAAIAPVKEPVKVDVEPAAAELAEPIPMTEAAGPVPPAQIFDEQA
jgi:hypothetical protein